MTRFVRLLCVAASLLALGGRRFAPMEPVDLLLVLASDVRAASTRRKFQLQA